MKTCVKTLVKMEILLLKILVETNKDQIFAAFSRPRRTGAAAPVLWARVCPLAPLFPGAYIYPPWGSAWEDMQSLG